jgi:uncharacterized protein
MVQMDPQVPMDVTDDDKLWALLSWIFAPLVPIIVLLLEDKKTRPFIKYNAVQGLVVGGLITVLSAITAGFGCLVLWVVVIYQIYLGIQSYQGKWVTIPVVTDFVKGQGWIS